MAGSSPRGGGPGPAEDWTEVLADIGDRIRAERQARGWTQAQLSERAGLGHTAAGVGHLETGHATLFSTFVLACIALGVDMAHMLSTEWRMPDVVPSLSPQQARVLREAASGDSLAQLGSRLGMTRPAVSSHLSRVYLRLGVTHLPRGERRAAAVRVAVQHGLLGPETRTS